MTWVQVPRLTPEQLLAYADAVRAAALGPSRVSTPPRDVFRPNVAGRKKWLEQAEKTLRFSGRPARDGATLDIFPRQSENPTEGSK